jgi:hypothetical protein
LSTPLRARGSPEPEAIKGEGENRLPSSRRDIIFTFIKFASKNPFLWTGMKDASAESRK